MPSRKGSQGAADPAAVIRRQVVLEEHDVAADGSFAVVVRRFVHGDRYRSHLWRIPLSSSGRPAQLTSGGVRDTWPRIAPDGSAVAFRRTIAASRLRDVRGQPSDPDAETARLRVIPLRADGRAGRLWAIRTPRRRSVNELAWSPDSRRLAVTLDVDPPRFIVGPDPRGDEEPLARRIRRIDWRMDETGHVDRWAHLHVVEARHGAAPRQLTRGDWGVSGIAWSPDGRSIAFVADPRPDADVRPRTSIWTIRVDGDSGAGDGVGRAPGSGEPREALSLGGNAHSPAWSPDGRWLAAIGWLEVDPLDDVSPGIVVGPADGSSPAWPLAPGLDRPIGSWVDTDLHGWSAYPRITPCWADPGTIVALVSDRGRVGPWRFDLDPTTGWPRSEPVPLTTGDVAAQSLAVASDPAAPRDARVTVLTTVGRRPVELVTFPLDARASAGRNAVFRTRLGGRWATRFAWPAMRNVQAPGPGGPIETWIASPDGAGDAPLPTVVDVHGGPLGAWTRAPSIEVVLLCARGYRVVLPNIRGSAGYGRDWVRPQLGDWGGVDAADVHAALDHSISLGLVDADRIGALGLSYGGFMVNWLLGTSDRFRAGVSEAGVTNQIGDWANSDTGVEYNRMALLGAPTDPEGVANLWRQSPLANVASIRTPLLMLQGEADRRCPPGDNEQLFVALRVLGRTVEYVLYPEESHVYQASGRPDRRIDRHTRMLDWFDRYLRG
ncbi:MAG TPA: prolyl oligopeptidase family serine peptidase [Candidatus Deferrimicrobiaceae bacterium]|nr:prolyl oligopeptidase family serine peptidase [Candidatus Deferrimicrobiaceae bacterium]